MLECWWEVEELLGSSVLLPSVRSYAICNYYPAIKNNHDDDGDCSNNDISIKNSIDTIEVKVITIIVSSTCLPCVRSVTIVVCP